MSTIIRRYLVVLIVVLLTIPALTSCGPPSVAVTEESYQIKFANNVKMLPSGNINFHIKNNANGQAQEFVIFKTDLPPDQLPLNDDGDVDEQGPGIKHIAEVEDIGTSETKKLKVNLPPGNYVALCNLPGHYAQGMYYSFTVR